MLHGWRCANPPFSSLPDLLKVARTLASGVIPNEYGCTPHQKINIGKKICLSLLDKILADMQHAREESKVITGMVPWYLGTAGYLQHGATTTHWVMFATAVGLPVARV